MKKIYRKLVDDDYSIKEKSLFVKFQLLWFIFYASAIVGFIYEEIYFLVDEGILTYRGTMWGPYVPVYGVGAVLMYLLLNRFRRHPVLVFILSMLVTGVLEYATGWVLYESFHKMWWTYEGCFLNIDNYVCLRSVLSFAIGGLLLFYFLAPRLLKFFGEMSAKKRNIVFFILILLFFVDIIMSIVFPNSLGVVS